MATGGLGFRIWGFLILTALEATLLGATPAMPGISASNYKSGIQDGWLSVSHATPQTWNSGCKRWEAINSELHEPILLPKNDMKFTGLHPKPAVQHVGGDAWRWVKIWGGGFQDDRYPLSLSITLDNPPQFEDPQNVDKKHLGLFWPELIISSSLATIEFFPHNEKVDSCAWIDI